MQGLTVSRAPLAPLGGDLTNGSIRAARHITDNSIELDSGVFTRLAVFVFELGEELGLMVGYDDVSGVEPVHLVGEHERPLRVGIIGYHEPFGLA